jgi:FkbM family methyltransferase
LNSLANNARRFLLGGQRERTLLRRKLVYRLIARNSSLVGVVTPYGHFVMDSCDQGVSESLFAFRGNDDCPVLHEAVATAERHGKLQDRSLRAFVDVGANIGTTTVPALKSLGFGSAVAFEPSPQNLRLLRANIALNDLADEVRVVPTAVGAEVSRMTLWLGEANHGDHRLWHRDNLGLQAMSGSVDVDVQPLDQLLADIPDPGMVWIDTQGYEGFVLAGAPATLRKGIPIVTEFWPDGMKASNSWEMCREIISSAAFLKDLRTGKEYEKVSLELLDNLAREYAGISTFTDLLFWF